jgi:AcrR family transcriptional regulator
MSDPIRSERRTYRSPRREQQAAQTREAVVAAAADLFAARGWAATGMRDVAAQAGVSVETVYSTVGSKTDLLVAAIDVSVVGDAEPVPLAERPEFAALGVGTIAQRSAAAARLVTAIHERNAQLQLALAQGAASEPELARLVREAEARRRLNVRQAAELVTRRSVQDAEADALWAVTSADVFRLLTGGAGWSVPQYEAWVARAIARELGVSGG